MLTSGTFGGEQHGSKRHHQQDGLPRHHFAGSKEKGVRSYKKVAPVDGNAASSDQDWLRGQLMERTSNKHIQEC